MKESKKKKSISNIIGVILCVIFVPIIIINLTLIINSYIHPDELPGIFGIKPAVVLSGSMEPKIKTGDLIFIHEIDPSKLKNGDVICYLVSGKAITHRIVDITTSEEGDVHYVTQGDANNVTDGKEVKQDQIQGVWKGERISGLGKMILFMQTTLGMILFIVCPLLLFILWDLFQRYQSDKAEARRTSQLEEELAVLKSKEKSG